MSDDDALPLFPPLAKSDLVARIEEELRRAIVSGRLGPGARVVEVDVARQLGVSRAPVREAARRLESLGLLVSRPGHGFAVRTFSAGDVEDLFPVRIQLERTSVELACARATDVELAAFPRKVDVMVAQADSLPTTVMIARDLDFHVSIAEASGNRYLHRLLKNVQAELTVFLTLGAASAYDPRSLAETHRPLADALARRDVDATLAALDLHLADAWLQARRFFADEPQPLGLESVGSGSAGSRASGSQASASGNGFVNTILPSRALPTVAGFASAATAPLPTVADPAVRSRPRPARSEPSS